jgi:hypothetical protein
MPIPNDLPPSEHIWIDVEGPFETSDKAFLYETKVGRIWLPKSQCGARKKNPDGSHCRIEITKWVAREKGLLRDGR